MLGCRPDSPNMLVPNITYYEVVTPSTGTIITLPDSCLGFIFITKSLGLTSITLSNISEKSVTVVYKQQDDEQSWEYFAKHTISGNSTLEIDTSNWDYTNIIYCFK